MTWAEYQIRLFSLNKKNEFEKHKLQILANTIIDTSMIEVKYKRTLINDLDRLLFGEKARDKENKRKLEFFKQQRAKYKALKDKK
jgi:hypothetical protein